MNIKKMSNLNSVILSLKSRKLSIFLLSCSVLFVPVDFWYKPFRYVGGGAPIPQLLRAMVLFFCLLYIFKKGLKLGKYGFELGTTLTLFIMLWVLHSFVGEFSLSYDVYYIIKSSFFIIITVTFYRLMLSGSVEERDLIKCYRLVVIFAAGYAISLMSDPNVEIGQNAGSYIILWCLPLLLKDRSPLSLLIVVMGFVAIFMTVKRGPIVALFAGIVCYFIVGILIRQKMLSLRKLVSVGIVLVGLSVSIYWQYDNLEARFEQLANVDRSSQEEVDKLGSGRVLMARVHLAHYIEGGFVDQIIGYGNMQDYLCYAEYRQGLGVVAHSTWIETIHNYGALGVFLFLAMLYKIFRTLVYTIKIRHPIAQPLAMGLISFFLTSFYSSVLFSPESIYFGFLIAYSMAIVKKYNGTIPKNFIDKAYIH